VIELASIAVRACAAAILIVMGVSKVVVLVESPGQLWLPVTIPRSAVRCCLALVVLGELGLGVAVLVVPVPRLLVVLAVTCFFLMVTPYGIGAVRRNRDCGCGGRGLRVRTQRTLVLRNTIMLGTMAVGVLLGPTLGQIAKSPGPYARAVAMTPIALFVFAAFGRTAQRYRLHRTDEKQRAVLTEHVTESPRRHWPSYGRPGSSPPEQSAA